MSNAFGPFNLASTFLRLRNDVSIEALPVDETFWQRISTGLLGAFQNEYLVTLSEYANEWPMWERHPNGDEIVLLLTGSAMFVLDLGDETQAIELEEPGNFVLVPKGTWHTASFSRPSRMLFITAGEGTEHRPRVK